MGTYSGWAPYVPVAERRKKAQAAAKRAAKVGAELLPVAPYCGAIAKTFWGKAWSANLEAYSDYANRLPRGRTYVRNGSVIDLRLAPGHVQAQVVGSRLYRVGVKVEPIAPRQWQSISKDCSNSIDSLVELLQGKLSTAVMQRICAQRTGLFPAPKEMRFSCTCPDAASMCKHVAAVLYGVGARLDQQPELLFTLRGVDAKDLVGQAGAGLVTAKKTPATGKVLEDASLADVFGIEMDERGTPGKEMKVRKTTPPGHAGGAGAAATQPHVVATKAPAARRTPAAATPTKKAPAAKRATSGRTAAGDKKDKRSF